MRRALSTGVWGTVEGHARLHRVRIEPAVGGGFLILTDEQAGTFDVWVESEDEVLDFITGLTIVWPPQSGAT